MDVADAIIASDLVKTNKIIGVHYNTFPYIVINEKEAVNRFKAKGKELILIKLRINRIIKYRLKKYNGKNY